MHVDWYFDFVSPYAYLQVHRLPALPQGVELHYRPVLFAALLNHWGQLGPAEVPPKRLFTYRHVIWLASKQGIEITVPAAHPFNPLRLLRLAILVKDDYPRLREMFSFVWRDGCLPSDERAWQRLIGELGIPDAASRIETVEIKAALRSNGEAALRAGVFGVPSFVVDGTVLWGLDAFDMLNDYLNDPSMLRHEDLGRLASLPIGADRRRRGTAASGQTDPGE